MIGIDKLPYFWKWLFFKTNLLSSMAHNLVETYTNRHCCWSCKPETIQIIRPLIFSERNEEHCMQAIMHSQSKTQIVILCKILFFRKVYGKIYSVSVIHTLLLLKENIMNIWAFLVWQKIQYKGRRNVAFMKIFDLWQAPYICIRFALHNNYSRWLP